MDMVKVLCDYWSIACYQGYSVCRESGVCGT